MVHELAGGKEDLVVERWGVMVAGFQARDSAEAAARRSCDHRIGDEENEDARELGWLCCLFLGIVHDVGIPLGDNSVARDRD